MASRVKLIFPGTVAELKKIGVENELDFSYAMLQTFTVEMLTITGNTIHHSVIYYNRRLFKKSIDLFEEMFGRKPEGVWSQDWSYISQLEAARICNRKITYVSFICKVNSKVKKYYDNEEYLNKYTGGAA